ncbi:hypothetical protein [Brachybacterium timonense]|uniref:hypothetical protein n=1 Tax=Brachybacterium timonense TaxID=2050896 RepID=UPI003CCBF17A
MAPRQRHDPTGAPLPGPHRRAGAPEPPRRLAAPLQQSSAPHRLRRQAPDLTPPRQRRQRHDQLQRVAVYEHAERRRGLDKEGEDREGAVEVMANAALIVAASDGLLIQWLLEPSIELQQTLELFAVLLAP